MVSPTVNIQMVMKKQYDSEDLQKAMQEYMNGMKMKIIICRYPHVPKRTIFERAKKLKENVVVQKPGPCPLLTHEMEDDLKDWVIAMQVEGLPVTREMIFLKGNENYHEMFGNTRSVGNLSRSWVDKFMGRHPVLTIRSSQIIKCVRADATEKGLHIFLMNLSSTL